MKQVILMGVLDSKLVQHFITIAPFSSLDDMVQECYPKKPPATSHLRSRHLQRDAIQLINISTPTTRQNSNHLIHHVPAVFGHIQTTNGQHQSQCYDYGKRGYRSTTVRCPARNATCRICGQKGRYDQCCFPRKSRVKPKGK